MVKTKPVEILMATYNGSFFLREQIDSILEQTDENWHLTISDDGSEDGTRDIIDDYVQRFPEKITHYHSGKRFGNARDHFFHLMNRCGAEWMLFCDQDDTWYPNKVAKMRAAMKSAENQYGAETPLLVFSDQTPTDAQLRPLAPSLMRYQKQYFEHFDYRSILMQNVVTGGAMGINRALAELGGQCADTSRVIMHDWWLAAVAARFGQIVYLDEPLGTYRQHGKNEVGAKNVRAFSHVINRVMHQGDIRELMLRKKRQAEAFSETFSDMLSLTDAQFLHLFILPRSGPGFYWRERKLIHGGDRLLGMMVWG